MKMTVIGGSAACPNPGDAGSSYLITHDRFSLLLDCGPDSISKLRQQTRLRDIGAVVISHLHSDHTLDLVPFRYGLRYIPGGRGERIPLWMPPGGRAFLDQLGRVFALGGEANEPFFDTEFAIDEYEPDMPFVVGPYSISFMPTRHFIDCWAMRIRAGGRDLAYLADSAPIDALVDFARDADLAICEATLPIDGAGSPENSGHMTSAQAGEIAQRAGVRHLVLTHRWAEHDIEESVREVRATFAGAVTIAASGVQVIV